ncbi:MAG TPA: OsmC family protein [Woeseiaceae bacterium]|nr:OsmC family protein [Woeseiaceae bacterium]
MSEYTATVAWERGDQPFTDGAYSRGHRWMFDGGAIVEASASPQVVPVPMSVPEYVDPEEAYVAAIASCHMLFFLSIAGKRRYVVDSYTDAATGYMEKRDGREWVTKVVLQPKVTFVGERVPTNDELEKLHHKAHELCFIANSVKTEIIVRVTS